MNPRQLLLLKKKIKLCLAWLYVCCLNSQAYLRVCLKIKFMCLVYTRMPGESYRRRLRSLLYLCYVFPVLTNSLEC